VAVAESAPWADAQSVNIICTTVGQHFNRYRALCGSFSDRWVSCLYWCWCVQIILVLMLEPA